MENRSKKAAVIQILIPSILIQVCLGTVYGWSIFSKPLMALHGWSHYQVTIPFSIAIGMIGLSACFTGCLADSNPRRVAMIGGVLFGLGMLLAGIAIKIGSLILLYVGYGFISGCGIGLGYLVPIAVSVKWMPNYRGLVGGLVVMGFGAGAMLMGFFGPGLISKIGPDGLLSWSGLIFLVVITFLGSCLKNPDGYEKKTFEDDEKLSSILFSKEFVFLWLMMFLNVCAGIALISQAYTMGQELYSMTAASAGILVAALGLFNAIGRVFWPTVSEKIGRQKVFLTLFLTQGILFILIPFLPGTILFSIASCYVLLCYGGGFGTMPAQTADIFGTRRMGKIYGPILTAWSAAGIASPMFYSLLREATGVFKWQFFLTAAVLVPAMILPLSIKSKIKTQ